MGVIRFCTLIKDWFFYLLVIYCFANTIYAAFALDSWTHLVSAELAILLVFFIFVIIYFIFCFIIEPGEVKESINISELSEENKYTLSDSIDKKGITRAMVYFCPFCNAYRPPHAFHCAACKKCTLYMWGHHPLFRKCIGYYNLKFLANLYFYIGIGLIIVFCLDYEIMRNSKTPYYDADLIFMFTFSAIFSIPFLLYFLNMLKCAADISYFLEFGQDIYGSASWYENFQTFFGKNFWTWFLPIKVPKFESLGIDLRLNTHYGGVIKLKNKFIV